MKKKNLAFVSSKWFFYLSIWKVYLKMFDKVHLLWKKGKFLWQLRFKSSLIKRPFRLFLDPIPFQTTSSLNWPFHLTTIQYENVRKNYEPDSLQRVFLSTLSKVILKWCQENFISCIQRVFFNFLCYYQRIARKNLLTITTQAFLNFSILVMNLCLMPLINGNLIFTSLKKLWITSREVLIIYER